MPHLFLEFGSDDLRMRVHAQAKFKDLNEKSLHRHSKPRAQQFTIIEQYFDGQRIWQIQFVTYNEEQQASRLDTEIKAQDCITSTSESQIKTAQRV